MCDRACGTAGIVLLSVLSGCSRGSVELSSAILITLDTTRADALGAYGRQPTVTPTLDRLASKSLVYTNAHTVAPLTLPAHASMLTGLYPPRHSVRDNGLTPVPQAAFTLAEAARDSGFQTGAFVSAIVLDRIFALDQGFATYGVPPNDGLEAGGEGGGLRADKIVDSACAWLARRERGRPFFLWVHFFDPHAPYRPPSAFLSGDEDGQEVDDAERYLGEVAAMDHELGRLMDALEKDGVLDSTTILVIADHGEGLGDRGELSHGFHCYEPTMRIPLILCYPDGYRAGETSNEIVSAVDVAPTLAAAMGFAFPTDIDGLSLYRRSVPAERGVYFESYAGFLTQGWSQLSGWLDSRGKYVFSSEPEFFDLLNDPEETTNRIRETETSGYERAIALVSGLPVLAKTEAKALDQELVEGIRALGYGAVSSSHRSLPDLLEPTDLPSPASRREAMRDLIRASGLLRKGEDLAEGLALLEGILAENPMNHRARDLLVTGLLRSGRDAEMVAHLTYLVQNGFERPATFYNLGVLKYRFGKQDQGIAYVERALEMDPTKELYRKKLAEMLRDRR